MSDNETSEAAGSEGQSRQADRVPSMPRIVATELARASPRLLLALFVLLGVALFRQPIATLLDRSTEIGLGPVTLKAAEAKLQGVKLTGTDQAKDFTSEQIATLTERYDRSLAGGRNAGVLWVDDTPQNNKDIVDFLDLVGVTVIIARSYPEAIARLEERSFNAVVSDWSRPGDLIEQQARASNSQFWGSGAQLGQTLAKSGCGRQVILFSAGSVDEVPMGPGILAQTNDYYTLLLLIADKLRDETRRCYLTTR